MGRLPTVLGSPGFRCSRRRLFLLGQGLLLAACRRGEGTPQAPASPTPGMLRTPEPTTVPAVLVTPTPVRPTPTPTAVPTPTAAQRELRLFARLRLDEPRSHDFNADVECGGEPELFAGLVRLSPDYEVRPDWAERWEVSADGTRWVFALRDAGSGWSDGQPVRAADFVWSWRRSLDPERPAPQAQVFDIVGNARAVLKGELPAEALAVRALDDRTLEVELERPAGYFLLILGTAGLLPAYRPAVERWGASWTEAGKCVSNGPFRLVAWERGSGYVVARNSSYWNQGLATIDRCTVAFARPEDPLLPFYRGSVDFAPVPPELLPEVTSQEGLLDRIVRSILPEVWSLVVQPDAPPLERPELRAALSRAIDRERLRQLAYGAVEPATALVPPGVPGFLQEERLVALHRFAPLEVYRQWESVRQEVAAPLRLVAPATTDPVEETVLLDVVEQLRSNLGIEIVLERREGDAWARAVAEGEFELLWWRWPLPFPDGAAVYEWLVSRERRTLHGLRWQHDELDRFLALARNEIETARRLGAYRQCELLLQEAFVAIPVVYPAATYLVQPWVASLPRARDGMLVAPGTLFNRFLSGVVVRPRSG
ncbi:MAG: peptide ABC transporter substrate-binding protein [Thermomicrobium sp.]|nr:peptide ABC transporter substrate-binding protein [Thermomicrobium sp.]